jgi:ankyrin repeat protein
MYPNAMMRAALTAHRATDLGQQLVTAVYDNNIDKVRQLLTIPGININYQGSYGHTALMNSVYLQNKPDIMKLLLAHRGINVNLKNHYGQTALLMATTAVTDANSKEPALSKNLECIRQLVAVPTIELNTMDRDGYTALVNAIRFLKLGAFNVLLDAGANVNTIDTTNESSITALMEAAKGPNIEMLRRLLAIPGIEINAVNQKNETALFIAVNWWQRSNVQELLKHPQIAVNILAYGEISPIMRASQRNADGIIRDLLLAGAIVPQPVPEPIAIQLHFLATERQRTEQALFQTLLGRHAGNIEFINKQTYLAPSKANMNRNAQNATQRLILAVRYLDVEEVRQLLKVPNINVNFQTWEGESALYSALNAHGTFFGPKKAVAKEILDVLLAAKGLNPNTPIRIELPLFIALKNYDKYALDALLNHFAIDLDAKDRNGQNVLMYAIEKYSLSDPYVSDMKKMIDMILEKNININAVDHEGRTALFLAAAGIKSDLVDALLEQDGIDLNIRDRYGNSAMSYSVKVWGRNARPMVRKFLEMGAEVRPDDPPLVQEESSKLIRETLNKMSTSRRNPLNPDVMGEIKKFVGGMMRTRRVRKSRRRR